MGRFEVKRLVIMTGTYQCVQSYAAKSFYLLLAPLCVCERERCRRGAATAHLTHFTSHLTHLFLLFYRAKSTILLERASRLFLPRSRIRQRRPRLLFRKHLKLRSRMSAVHVATLHAKSPTLPKESMILATKNKVAPARASGWNCKMVPNMTHLE